MNAASSRESVALLLAELTAIAPGIRIGQLLDHLAFLAEDEYGKPMSAVEDDELMAVLQRHRQELLARKDVVVASR